MTWRQGKEHIKRERRLFRLKKAADRTASLAIHTERLAAAKQLVARHASLEHLLTEAMSKRAVQSRRDKKKEMWKTVVQGLTVATSAFALWYARDAAKTAFAQMQESHAQTQQMIRQQRHDERPWVRMHFPKDPKEQPLEMVVAKPFGVTAHMSNLGKTVATDLIAKFYVEVLRPDQTPSFNTETPPTVATLTRGALFPTEEQVYAINWLEPGPFPGTAFPRMVSQEDLVSWNSGSIYFAVYGRVDYQDVNGIAHWSTFCTISKLNSINVSGEKRCLKDRAWNNVDKNDGLDSVTVN